jgi:arginine decarboxylase
VAGRGIAHVTVEITTDHSSAPILEGIEHYHSQGFAPFTMPGHKLGRGVAGDVTRILGEETFRCDVALAEGIDDRQETKNLQGKAEALAADAYGAEQTLFSTNGSSLSIQVCMMAVASPDDEIVIARNVHKSGVAGLILGGHKPAWVYPAVDDELQLSHCVTPEAVARALEEHPKAKAVVVVSPTYYGVVGDLRRIAQECHTRGVPLVVDEAWGAHLPFHPDLPDNAMQCGADLSVTSLHKMASGLQQGSMIHVQGERIDRTHLTQVYDQLESTSISSLVLGVMDGSRRQYVREGRQRLSHALSLADRARRELNQIPGVRAVRREELQGKPGVHAVDELQLTIDVKNLGISGFAAADWLRKERRVTMELSTGHLVMAVVTIADTEETIDRLVEAFKALAEWSRTQTHSVVRFPPMKALRTEQVRTPRSAFFGKTTMVPLKESVGEVMAELLTPYPPGIPVIVPGERMTEEIVTFLEEGLKGTMVVKDAADESVQSVRVVADG